MKPIAIIDAPSVLGLFPGGVEHLPDALHALDLGRRLGAVAHHRVDVPPHAPVPDPASGVNNAAALSAYAARLAPVVAAALDEGAFPLVLGGDCTIVFGPLLALADRGSSGLLFLDGHADFAHPRDEPSGEAASMDLALATGRGPAEFGRIGGHARLVADEHVVVLGYRVHGDGTDRCAGVRVDETAITAIDLDALRRSGVEHSVRRALDVVGTTDLDGFWIHIDADVLDDELMPAVDYRNPGGLTWDELTLIVTEAIGSGRACGLDLTIFNPTLDPTGAIAARVVDFLVDVLT